MSSFIFFAIEANAINTEATGFRINSGDSTDVDVHSDCLNVSNSSSNDIFIPTKSALEWTTFQSNLPASVTTGPCSGGSPLLTFSGATKTEDDCTGAGGSVVSTVDGTVCRFNSASCPGGGWTNAGDWSTTTSNSTTASYSNYGCSYTGATCKGQDSTSTIFVFGGGSETLTTGSHSWSNTAVELDQCLIPTGCTNYRSPNCDNPSWNYNSTVSSTSNITLCGGNVVKATTDQVLIDSGAGSETIGVTAQVETTYSTVYASVTQIGCR